MKIRQVQCYDLLRLPDQIIIRQNVYYFMIGVCYQVSELFLHLNASLSIVRMDIQRTNTSNKMMINYLNIMKVPKFNEKAHSMHKI